MNTPVSASSASDNSVNKENSAQRDRAQAVCQFWFDADVSEQSQSHYRKEWFIKSDAFDQQIRQQFLTDIENAAQGLYDAWQDSPKAAVALIILLDQFPRNVYRGTPRSFATDAKAIEVVQHLVNSGLDETLPPAYRFFVYVPFEHQEAIAFQDQAVAKLRQLIEENPDIDKGFKSGLDYAIRHRDVIERFGRFPHRNEILGRKSTPEEKAFLQQPGSRF